MLCKEIAKDHPQTYSFYDPSYANMIHFLQLLDSDNKDSPSRLVKEIQQTIKRLLKLETVVGIGNVICGITNFKTGYISSLLAWSQSQLGSQSQVLDESNVKEEVFEFSPEIERKLTNGIESVNYEAFKENIYFLLEGDRNLSIMSFTFAANRVLFLLGSLARKYNMETNDFQKVMWNCQQSIWELNSHTKVIEHLLQLAKLIIEKVHVARFSNGKIIVASVQQYLEQHYASEISLSMLSELFHINSAHLSETFKHTVGQNFSDYLVQLRLQKARQFLKDKQLKIIDVANLTGFSNSGYFSTVFKKYFGQTPVEFRNSLDL
jgi:two-component system response regulator YesN